MIFKKLSKLIAAAALALSATTAPAVVIDTGGGNTITFTNGSNGLAVFVTSVYENIVTNVGQTLSGVGEFGFINGDPTSTYCSSACEVTFRFTDYTVTGLTSSNATFSGGVLNVYVGFGANNDFNPQSSASSAADLTAATNGTLLLTLTGHALDAAGNTLEANIQAGDFLTPSFRFFGGGIFDVNLAGAGVANPYFNTNGFVAAFGSAFADMEFSSSGSTSVVPHPSECAPAVTFPGGAECVFGSADIRAIVAQVPEPDTLALLALGLAGLGLGALRRRKSSVA